MDTLVDSNHQKFDVWLFAADIVNFVFLMSSKLSPEVAVGHFPGFVCKDFSDILKIAVQVIRDMVKKDVDEEFAKFQQQDDLSPGAYTKYAKDLRKARFCKGFEAEAFLHYCVNLACMAYRFCQGGVRKAQISAVFCVAEDLQDCGLNYSLWEALNEIAEKIVGGVAGGTNIQHHRPLSRGIATKDNDYFTSPEIYFKDRGITSEVKAHTNPVGRSVKGNSSKLCSSADLSKEKHFTRGILANSCRRTNTRVKYYPIKDRDTMFSLHESLELSLEQLSISSALPLELLKDEYASNSTPAESSVKWKQGILKRITFGNSFQKKMFKLSPINRIKAESLIFH